MPFRRGQQLAAGIPNARLVPLEGTMHVPFLGDTDSVVTAIDEFLSEGAAAQTGVARLAADDVHTILFTDVEGSTALTDRLGDAKARDLLREHERITRDALKAHGGSEVKTMGDGFMVSFGSATKALECAITMQAAFAKSYTGRDHEDYSGGNKHRARSIVHVCLRTRGTHVNASGKNPAHLRDE